MREQIQLECIVRDLERSFTEAWDAFAGYIAEISSQRLDDGYHKESLHDHIKSIYVRLQFAYEALGFTSLLAELRDGFESYRERWDAITPTSLGSLSSPLLEFLEAHLRPLKASVPSLQEMEIQNLERILLETPAIMRERGLEPTKEKEVRKVMFETLSHIYPGTVPEVSIPKPSRVYKLDIGIPPLKAGIEFKFADSEQEIKTAISGIYEDAAAYAGSEAWKIFFAVFYITDQFLTQAQVDGEFRMSKIDRSWKPLVVFGRGARPKRNREEGGEREG